MSVLIISAAGTLIALSLLTLGMFSQNTSFALEQGYRAQTLARACANVALRGIRLNANYVGGENVAFGADHCDVLPITKEGNVYTIRTQGVADTVLRKNEVVVTRAESEDPPAVTLAVDSWREVANF